ncbi:MAG: hypothetical protein APF82_05375 [Sphingomonadales bacterium BRH_c42]|nr:MAG: hypothetical protein APF82_05375 [Sphingomonadales bacterium BRH_c42]
MGRAIVMLVSLACYAAFFVTFLYLIGFVGGFAFMPSHVDKGMQALQFNAVLVDIGLIALFGIQHSVMARKGFKQSWTRIVPVPLERSIYCLATVLVLVTMYRFWQPIEGSLWSMEGEGARTVMWALFWLGWGTVLLSTFLLNHFELFGLQQAWMHLREKEASPPQMRSPLFYNWVRHPIYAGFLLAFWATPDMTYGHLLFAAGFTIYILIGIAYEERDLTGIFGEEYLVYRSKVGMLLPGVGKNSSP